MYRLSKRLGKSPKDIGSEIKEKIIKRITDIEKVEIAGPGFINFFIKDDNFFEIINEIIKLNSNYGKNQSAKGIIPDFTESCYTGLHTEAGRIDQSCDRFMVDLSFLQFFHDRICNGQDSLQW